MSVIALGTVIAIMLVISGFWIIAKSIGLIIEVFQVAWVLVPVFLLLVVGWIGQQYKDKESKPATYKYNIEAPSKELFRPTATANDDDFDAQVEALGTRLDTLKSKMNVTKAKSKVLTIDDFTDDTKKANEEMLQAAIKALAKEARAKKMNDAIDKEMADMVDATEKALKEKALAKDTQNKINALLQELGQEPLKH